MSEAHEVHLVPEGVVEERLSDYVVGKFYGLPSRKSVKKAIKSGELLVDGVAGVTGLWVKPGMVIAHYPVEREREVFECTIPVVYQDEHIAIVNKPAGIPTSGDAFRTLENALAYNLPVSSFKPSYKYPKPVHRLDHGTSGLVIVARTPLARATLGRMLEKREIHKSYHAVVRGQEMEEEGELHLSIEGKPAHSLWKVVSRSPNGKYSLLKLFPITGRTHQLRIHCSSKGFPIVGDKQYSNAPDPGKGLMLCATGLSFDHPFRINQNLLAEIEVPNKFKRLMKR